MLTSKKFLITLFKHYQLKNLTIMQLNRPYLWLGVNAGNYTLEILANAAGSYRLYASAIGNRLKLVYKDDGGGVNFSQVNPYTPVGINVSAYTKITVVIKDANNIIKGSCTVYTSLADTNFHANRPYGWLSSFPNPSKLYVKVNNGQVVVTAAPNDHSDANRIRTINCTNTGALPEADAALDSTTSYDPSNTDYITAEVKTTVGGIPTTVGVVSTGSTDGDASGGNELLDDLFD